MGSRLKLLEIPMDFCGKGNHCQVSTASMYPTINPRFKSSLFVHNFLGKEEKMGEER